MDQPPIDPALFHRDDMRAVLARRDIGALYRALKDAGVSQRRIAARTGQSQSEVSEILKGRMVSSYDLLARIADGLGIPREFMGLSSGDTYSEKVTVADPDEVEEMLRRHLLALGALGAFGAPVTGLGELAPNLPAPAIPRLPGRIGIADVKVIHDYTDHLRVLARIYGGQGRPAAALAEWADQWLATDASDSVRRALLGELADLHTIAAWCCHDSGAATRSHHHFARSVQFAQDAGDRYRAAYALRHAAMMLIHRGEPNDALKATQMATVQLTGTGRDDQRVPVLQAWCHVVSGLALSQLDGVSDSTAQQAHTHLARARDGWEPPSTHARADMDLITGLTQLRLGALDPAEATLSVAAGTFRQSGDRREGVVAELVLARVHVQAGDSRGLSMAREAISAVSATQSGNARELWLEPLAEALDTRPGADARDLARQARQVAATRG